MGLLKTLLPYLFMAFLLGVEPCDCCKGEEKPFITSKPSITLTMPIPLPGKLEDVKPENKKDKKTKGKKRKRK